MGADADGIYISGVLRDRHRQPGNKKFLAAMEKKFGADLKTPNDLSVPAIRGDLPLQGGGREGRLDRSGQA